MTWLFLAGQSQAGKTLFEAIISICVPQSKIFFHSDFPFFFLNTYSMVNDNKWSQVRIKEVTHKKREFAFNIDHNLPIIDDPIQASRNACEYFQQAICPDADIFGDFSQFYYTPSRYQKLRSIFPDAKFIIIFRNPSVITPLRKKLLDNIGVECTWDVEKKARKEQEQMRTALTRDDNELVIDVTEFKRKPNMGLHMLLEHIGIPTSSISTDQKEKALAEIVRYIHEDIPEKEKGGSE